MIKAYLVGISTQYENEDIQIRYRIYKDQELICEKLIFQGYKKPLVVSHVALLTLLKELKKYMKHEIIIVINDAALNEQIRGTSTTRIETRYRREPEVLIFRLSFAFVFKRCDFDLHWNEKISAVFNGKMEKIQLTMFYYG